MNTQKAQNLIDYIKKSKDSDLLETLFKILDDRDNLQTLLNMKKPSINGIKDGIGEAISVTKNTGKCLVAAGKSFFNELRNTYSEIKNHTPKN